MKKFGIASLSLKFFSQFKQLKETTLAFDLHNSMSLLSNLEAMTCNPSTCSVYNGYQFERPPEVAEPYSQVQASIFYVIFYLSNPVEKKKFSSSYDVITDYAELSTIQGLVYIFLTYQTTFGKLFWTMVVTFMFALGTYWCIGVYNDWQKNPTLTTVTTTAYPVKQVILCAMSEKARL